MTGLQLSDSYRTFLETSTSRYEQSLSPDVEEYLMGREEGQRGLTQEIVERFRLGYVADPLPGHEHVRGRISIPYLTPDGSTIDVKFRKLREQDYGDKYTKLVGSKHHIFNTTALERGTSGIVICEGEIDAITSEQCGFPAVAIPGVQAWQPFWSRIFEQYSVVYMLADGDAPGKELYKKVAKNLDNVRLIPFEDKEDVNSFVLVHGAEGLKKKLNI